MTQHDDAHGKRRSIKNMKLSCEKRSKTRDNLNAGVQAVKRVCHETKTSEIRAPPQQTAKRLEQHHRQQGGFGTDEERQRHQPQQRGENPSAQSLASRTNGPHSEKTGGLNRRQP